MELTTYDESGELVSELFMMSKIQNLNGTHNYKSECEVIKPLFMMSKIQKLSAIYS